VILLLDNYDSFTYNLAQYLGELGCEVEVHRNDKISVEDIAKKKPERIVISPGPCTPQEASFRGAIEGLPEVSDSWRVPGAPGDWGGFWWEDKAGAGFVSWENQRDSSRWQGCVSEVGGSVYGHALSLADCGAERFAARVDDHRGDG
jgi:hypothetical protein